MVGKKAYELLELKVIPTREDVVTASIGAYDTFVKDEIIWDKTIG